MQKRYLYFGIASVLGLLIGGMWNFALAAWIAPVLWLRFYRESTTPGRDFLLMWASGAATTMISWRGATALGLGMPLMEPLMFVLMTPLGLLPYVIDRLYLRRFPNAAWFTLVFPVAFSAVDFFSSSGSPFGTFGAMAYAQRDALPVMQLAAVAGLWGIAFLIAWCASVLERIWASGFRPQRHELAQIGIVGALIALGALRLILPSSPGATAQIAGFSLPNGTLNTALSQLNSGDESGFRETAAGLHAAQLAEIRRLAQQGAQIVTLQEGAGLGQSDQVAQLLADAAALARAEQIYIVLPTFDLGATPPVNAVQIIDPSGAVVLRHVKYGGNQFEGTLKGDGVLQSVETPFGRISAVICWDADFPTTIMQAGQQGVDLLFVPAQDWLEVRDIHAGMATFRSVENGMSIVRQTGQGVSLISDARGATLARVDSFAAPNATLVSGPNLAVTLSTQPTLYPRIGDAFGNVMLLAFVGLGLGLLAHGLLQRRQRVAMAG